MKISSKKKKPAGISEKVIRILEIYTLIAQNQYPAIKFLQERFGVAKRTVHRYLEIINMIDQIEFDRDKEGYKFAHGDRIKKVLLSQDDLALLMAFGDTVAHLGSPLRNTFQLFLDKVVSVAKLPSKKGAAIVIKMPDAIENEHFVEYFNSISTCIEERRSMDIAYATRGTKEARERRVDPYGLIFHDGSWILIGYCHVRECVRRFALDRISKLKETWQYFKPEDNFNLDEHLSRSWGIYGGDESTLTVKFAAEIADLILRKKKWHPTEKREILPNGDIQLSFTIIGVSEIKKWIYTWLPYAEVVEPKWLRDQINQELSLSAQKHQ